MILAYVLALVSQVQQDPIKTVIDERAKQQAIEFLERLPLGVYRDDVLEQARESVFFEGTGPSSIWINQKLFMLTYSREERSVAGVAFSWPEEPTRSAEVSVEDAIENAKLCAQAILPQFGSWEVKLSVATERHYWIEVTAKIGEIYTQQTMSVQIRRVDGLPLQFSRNPIMDYAVYLGKPVISQQQALRIGLDAYNRFQPYEAGEVDSVRLILGVPIYSREMPNEVRPSDTEQTSRRVALPLYWIRVTNKRASQMFQHIYVHAIDGRALSVFPMSGFGGRPILHPLPKGALSVKFGPKDQQTILGPADKRTKKIDESLPVLLLSVGKALYSARYDPNAKLVWLNDGTEWAAYKPDPAVLDDLAKNAQMPGSFGKKKDGS